MDVKSYKCKLGFFSLSSRLWFCAPERERNCAVFVFFPKIYRRRLKSNCKSFSSAAAAAAVGSSTEKKNYSTLLYFCGSASVFSSCCTSFDLLFYQLRHLPNFSIQTEQTNQPRDYMLTCPDDATPAAAIINSTVTAAEHCAFPSKDYTRVFVLLYLVF